jgi:hypothetical protein
MAKDCEKLGINRAFPLPWDDDEVPNADEKKTTNSHTDRNIYKEEFVNEKKKFPI